MNTATINETMLTFGLELFILLENAESLLSVCLLDVRGPLSFFMILSSCTSSLPDCLLLTDCKQTKMLLLRNYKIIKNFTEENCDIMLYPNVMHQRVE